MAFSKARRLGELVTTAGVLDQATVATASSGDNDTSPASTAFVTGAIADLSDSAPGTLNTLNELAAALGDDANFSTTVTNSIATKLPLAGGTLTGNLAHASDFTLDVGGDITLDAGGENIRFDLNGNEVGQIDLGSANLTFRTSQGGDVIFRGTPTGATEIAMLTLDTSASGDATFSNDVYLANTKFLRWGDGSVRIYGDSSNSTELMTFVTGNSERLRIDQNGNISVNYSSSNDGVFHVKGSTNKTIKIDPTFSSGTHTSLAFARNGSDLWRVFQNSADEFLSFYNDGNSTYDFSLTDGGKIYVNVNPNNFSAYSGLGHFIVKQAADNLGIGVINSGADNTFKFINNGTEAKIEHNAAVPIKFEAGNTQHLEIHNSGAIKSGSGGMVLQTKEEYNSTQYSVSSNSTQVVVGMDITVKQGSKVAVWFHSGQIYMDGNSTNPNGHIQHVASDGTVTNISDHNGNHYWWDASTHIERRFVIHQGMSGSLSAGTYNVRFLAGNYGGNSIWNYQNKGAHLIVQEIASN